MLIGINLDVWPDILPGEKDTSLYDLQLSKRVQAQTFG